MTKKRLTVAFNLHGVDTPVQVADTADSNAGSAALEQFKNYKTVVIHQDSPAGDVYIPFHAVVSVAVSIQTVTEDDPTDDNCVTADDEGGEPNND